MWIKTPAGHADITYMGLSPGSYTLCVRMLRDDGTMGDQEAELDITILSPWYRSWWAWLVYALAVVGLVLTRRWWTGFFRHLVDKRRVRRHTVPQDAPAPQEEDVVEEAVIMTDDE